MRWFVRRLLRFILISGSRKFLYDAFVSNLIAFVGRPNVGKSGLFNRIVGKRIAIVHDQPGVIWRRLKSRTGHRPVPDKSAGLPPDSGRPRCRLPDQHLDAQCLAFGFIALPRGRTDEAAWLEEPRTEGIPVQRFEGCSKLNWQGLSSPAKERRRGRRLSDQAGRCRACPF